MMYRSTLTTKEVRAYHLLCKGTLIQKLFASLLAEMGRNQDTVEKDKRESAEAVNSFHRRCNLQSLVIASSSVAVRWGSVACRRRLPPPPTAAACSRRQCLLSRLFQGVVTNEPREEGEGERTFVLPHHENLAKRSVPPPFSDCEDHSNPTTSFSLAWTILFPILEQPDSVVAYYSKRCAISVCIPRESF